MSSSKKIFSGVIWSVLTNLVNALYGFIAIPLLIGHFGKAEYGLISLATSVNAYMQLMDMGLNSTNVRFFSNWMAKGDDDRLRKLFSTSNAFYGFVGIVNAIILLVVYCLADTFFNVTPEQCVILKRLLLILMAAALVNWYTSCFTQIIQASENVAWTQKRTLFTKCLLVVNLVLTIQFDFSITLYFLNTVLCVWLILPFVVRKVRSVAPAVTFRPSFDWNVFKEILPYSLNIFSFSIFSFSYNHLKSVFLGVQGTLESVTDYSVINSISALCSMVCGVFLTAMLPSASKSIANKDEKAYYRIAYNGTKYITFFVTFCVFGLMSISTDLLLVYVGPDFLYLKKWLNILLLTLLGNHILGISSLILGGENIRPLSRMTAVSSTLGLLVAWFAIPYYQVGGVVIATVVYCIGQQCFYYIYYFKNIMRLDIGMLLFKIVIPIFLIGIICYELVKFLPNLENNWTNIFVTGITFTILYAIPSYFLMNKDDKDFIKRVIRRNEK